jgi:hypothetical protein
LRTIPSPSFAIAIDGMNAVIKAASSNPHPRFDTADLAARVAL